MKKWGIWALGTLVALLVLLAALVWLTTFHPAALQSEPVICAAEAPVLRPSQQVKIMTWNVQFMPGDPLSDAFAQGSDTMARQFAQVDRLLMQFTDRDYAALRALPGRAQLCRSSGLRRAALVHLHPERPGDREA